MEFLAEIEKQEVTELFEREDKLKNTILTTKSEFVLISAKAVLEMVQNKIQKIHIAQTGK